MWHGYGFYSTLNKENTGLPKTLVSTVKKDNKCCWRGSEKSSESQGATARCRQPELAGSTPTRRWCPSRTRAPSYASSCPANIIQSHESSRVKRHEIFLKTLFVPRVKKGPLSILGSYCMHNIGRIQALDAATPASSRNLSQHFILVDIICANQSETMFTKILSNLSLREINQFLT